MPQWREEVDLRSNNVRSFVRSFFFFFGRSTAQKTTSTMPSVPDSFQVHYSHGIQDLKRFWVAVLPLRDSVRQSICG